jgi:NADH:ubiquinone oxidoreductase subunit E
MNERIKSIALECYNPYGNFDLEKFAKLIVGECASVGCETHGNYDVYDDILKHFGLEETEE